MQWNSFFLKTFAIVAVPSIIMAAYITSGGGLTIFLLVLLALLCIDAYLVATLTSIVQIVNNKMNKERSRWWVWTIASSFFIIVFVLIGVTIAYKYTSCEDLPDYGSTVFCATQDELGDLKVEIGSPLHEINHKCKTSTSEKPLLCYERIFHTW